MKVRGYGFQMVLSILISMVVSGDKTVHSHLSGMFGAGIKMGKDVFYRLKNNECR
jgi:hypothetical protein